MNITSGNSRSITDHSLIRNTSIADHRPFASMIMGPTNMLITPLVAIVMLVQLTIIGLAIVSIPGSRIVGWLLASDGPTGGIEAMCPCIAVFGSIRDDFFINRGASVTAVLSWNSLGRWRIILNF